MTTFGVFGAIFDGEGRILCVRRAYGPMNWTLPGGRVDPFESPLVAMRREVSEETGLEVEVGDLVGVYAASVKDDLVLLFECRAQSTELTRQPDGEIAECRFFGPDHLPPDLSERTRTRIADAFQGLRGVVRVFDAG